MNRLVEGAERWSRVALDAGWVEGWVEGAIFPRELVVFLAALDDLRIRLVVESGRQDGYSTAALGTWSTESGGRVVSVDLELDPERAEACRARLADYPAVEVLRGDAYELVGAALDTDEPTALLVDGPKGFPALSMLLAAAQRPSVRLLAQHNLDPGLAETGLLERRTGRRLHYEDLGLSGNAWRELGELELAFCRDAGAARSLEHSTLAIVPLDDVQRRRLWTTLDPRLSILQPPLVAVLWRAGRHRAVRELARASFSLQRRLRLGTS